MSLVIAAEHRSHVPSPCTNLGTAPAIPHRLRDEAPSAVGKWLADGAIARLLIAQRDLVRLGDVVGLDRSESLAEPLAGLAQELERVSGWTPGSCPLRLCPVFLDQMCQKGCSDFIGSLQRLIDGSLPRDIFNHAASIPCFRMDGTSPGSGWPHRVQPRRDQLCRSGAWPVVSARSRLGDLQYQHYRVIADDSAAEGPDRLDDCRGHPGRCQVVESADQVAKPFIAVEVVVDMTA